MNIELSAPDISDIVVSTLSSLLPNEACGPCEATQQGGSVMTGCVTINGDFKGAVTLECPTSFSKTLAASMFGLGPQAVNEEDSRDALAELTNIVAGNIKSIVTSMHGVHCQISLPIIALSGLEIPHSENMHALSFRCAGQVLKLQVLASKGGGRSVTPVLVLRGAA